MPTSNKTVLDSAIEVLEKLRGANEAMVKFKKRDGTIRVMKCTLNFDKVPKADKPKNINLPKILNLINKSRILHVYDLEKRGWRSIPIDRTEWLEADKVRYSVKL